MIHRHRSKPGSAKKARELRATGPNQVYSWDITWIPAMVTGMYFYLVHGNGHIQRRKIVGWQVYGKESSAWGAADLMTDLCHRERIEPDQVTLHSDNGGAMRGAALVVTLQKLGVAKIPSFGRPGVSALTTPILNLCSLFTGTMKYACPPRSILLTPRGFSRRQRRFGGETSAMSGPPVQVKALLRRGILPARSRRGAMNKPGRRTQVPGQVRREIGLRYERCPRLNPDNCEKEHRA